jgi:hypothetical protein
MLTHLRKMGLKAVHCPNGAVLAGGPRERAIQMNTLKASGLCVGFPDLIVFGKPGRVGFIEVKLEGEKQADSQVAVQSWLEEFGQFYAVCRSLADVDETLGKWGWR